MKILMVYPEFPDTFWSFKHALKFVHKRASSPPLGLATIAGMLPQEWDLKLIDMNVEALHTNDILWADFIFLSAMVVQRKGVRDVINRCKHLNKTIVAGGPLFTEEYEEYEDVDYLILNEAEITFPEFLQDLQNGELKRIYSTTEHPDMRCSPIPRWDLFNFKHYEAMPIQFSRGCPFNCDFCNVTALLGHRMRLKSVSQVIAELDGLYQNGWRRNIFFVDDNFIGNKKFVKEELLPALIEWRKGKTGFTFITQASINLSDDEELMNLMAQAGFTSVFIGIETPDEKCLTEAHKSQNKKRNLVDSVKALHKSGLQVMAGFIVGFDNDTSSIFKRQIEFIQSSGIITAMVGLLQAPNGTALYQRMKEEGRLLGNMSGDNVDGSSNIIPKMPIDELKAGYREILDNIYSPKLFYERVMTFLKDYKPINFKTHIEINEVIALFKSVFFLGIIGKERRYYWKLFFWTLFHQPKKFPLAITMTIYGYHFRLVNEMHVS